VQFPLVNLTTVDHRPLAGELGGESPHRCGARTTGTGAFILGAGRPLRSAMRSNNCFTEVAGPDPHLLQAPYSMRLMISSWARGLSAVKRAE